MDSVWLATAALSGDSYYSRTVDAVMSRHPSLLCGVFFGADWRASHRAFLWASMLHKNIFRSTFMIHINCQTKFSVSIPIRMCWIRVHSTSEAFSDKWVNIISRRFIVLNWIGDRTHSKPMLPLLTSLSYFMNSCNFFFLVFPYQPNDCCTLVLCPGPCLSIRGVVSNRRYFVESVHHATTARQS